MTPPWVRLYVYQFGERRPAPGSDEVGGQGFFADTAEAAEVPVKPRV